VADLVDGICWTVAAISEVFAQRTALKRISKSHHDVIHVRRHPRVKWLLSNRLEADYVRCLLNTQSKTCEFVCSRNILLEDTTRRSLISSFILSRKHFTCSLISKRFRQSG
jgi:hypothetical protein